MLPCVAPRPLSFQKYRSFSTKTQRCFIVPHGILHYLPFAALTNGKNYLGEKYTIFYLPSASLLPFVRNKSKPAGTQMLAIAQSKAESLPVLRYADEEVRAIAELFSTKAITTDNASKSEFLKRASNFSIIHIAAHAALSPSSPSFSRIMLERDNDAGVEVRNLYDLDLSKASLVVLSVCETGLGAFRSGDDFVGLNRALIYAGTPSVITSLWEADDESTNLLMTIFYSHLKQGFSNAEALKMAQIETRKKYPHPYYWAGFVLNGDLGLTASGREKQVRP